MDIYLVNSGKCDIFTPTKPLRNALYRNNGDGTFTDVTEKAGVVGGGYGMGVAVGDYNADGFPDLYVTQYGRSILYRNNGDGTFTDVSQRMGIADNPGKSWGVAATDINNNGWMDLFVSNDTVANFLFVNRAGRRFEDLLQSINGLSRISRRTCCRTTPAFSERKVTILTSTVTELVDSFWSDLSGPRVIISHSHQKQRASPTVALLICRSRFASLFNMYIVIHTYLPRSTGNIIRTSTGGATMTGADRTAISPPDRRRLVAPIRISPARFDRVIPEDREALGLPASHLPRSALTARSPCFRPDLNPHR